MPITPDPVNNKPPPDNWTDATFFDVTLVSMMNALIASGKYAPGPVVMELALAATAEIMVQTGRWAAPSQPNYTLDGLIATFQKWKGQRPG